MRRLEGITPRAVVSEVGPDVSRVRNAPAFASWLGLCPDKRISGGKVLSAKTPKVKNRVAIVAPARCQIALPYSVFRCVLPPDGADLQHPFQHPQTRKCWAFVAGPLPCSGSGPLIAAAIGRARKQESRGHVSKALGSGQEEGTREAPGDRRVPRRPSAHRSSTLPDTACPPSPAGPLRTKSKR